MRQQPRQRVSALGDAACPKACANQVISIDALGRLLRIGRDNGIASGLLETEPLAPLALITYAQVTTRASQARMKAFASARTRDRR